jgi:pimeloyl-ACP methyl ester carboxylesterase
MRGRRVAGVTDAKANQPRAVHTAALLSAALGLAAASVAARAFANRARARRARSTMTDPFTHEQFGRLPYDDSLVVASDGLDLHVEIVEPPGGVGLELEFVPAGTPDPTIVFVHGFCLDMGTFHFQRMELTRRGEYRLVFYDQPGHGRSAKLDRGEYTLERLGAALKDVLDATVPPDGPVVLVGHSMGGMTIMALAESYPELFGSRVRGVVLISSSAGKLDEVTFGMPDFLTRFTRPLVPVLAGAGRLSSSMIDGLRHASADLAWLLTRRYGFGPTRPSPTLVSYVERMNSMTDTGVVVRYLRAIYTHAGYPALEAIGRTQALVICGERDKLTPLSHSEEICRILPEAKLVVVPGAGHVALLESPEPVNEAIDNFLKQVA